MSARQWIDHAKLTVRPVSTQLVVTNANVMKGYLGMENMNVQVNFSTEIRSKLNKYKGLI